MLFQIGRAKKKGGRTNLPYVYTEQGVAMISSLLHSDIAISMCITIINTFVKMRHFIMNNKEIYLLGTSFNSLGEKISTFVKLEDKSLNAVLLKNINNIKKFNDK